MYLKLNEIIKSELANYKIQTCYRYLLIPSFLYHYNGLLAKKYSSALFLREQDDVKVDLLEFYMIVRTGKNPVENGCF